MHAALKNVRRNVCLALVLILPLSAGLVRLAATDDMAGDMCSGDMMWMIGWCLDGMTGAGSVSAFAAAAATASTASGTVETIDVLGSTGTRAFGINARGDIVGSFTNQSGTHGYVLSGGTFNTIDYPGAATTEAWGINPRGDIIGRYTIKGVAGIRGFLLSHGTYSDISVLKSEPGGGFHLATLPTKIGASGEVVGCFHDKGGVVDMYGYVQRGSNVAPPFTLPSNLGVSAMHNGITPGGGITVGLTFPTGSASTGAATTSRGYAVTSDGVRLVDYPGSTFTQLWDVNPSGTAVGQYTVNGRTNGFYVDLAQLADANAYHTINISIPGKTITMIVARGINPQGDIVGVYNDAAGAHGFVLRR